MSRGTYLQLVFGQPAECIEPSIEIPEWLKPKGSLIRCVGEPEDGYVLWLSDTYMNEFVWNFESPAVGEGMELEYFVYGEEEEGFSLDGVTQLIAGAPRLVKNGEICNEQEPQFSGDRFTETYVSGRTAAGVTADGKLLDIGLPLMPGEERSIALPREAQVLRAFSGEKEVCVYRAVPEGRQKPFGRNSL